MNENNLDLITFDRVNEKSSIIKVIGVGGGGGNAVNHMFREGIKDVTFVICNTDNQALNNSPIEKKIQLGPKITNGLGAGNNPDKAREAAEESIEDIKTVLSEGTEMVFITAGMGGGTGTGAAPVIAKVAKEMSILTVGIVTVPFKFEGTKKIAQALAGVKILESNVDALLVINNERLMDIYPDMGVKEAFSKADDVLKDAAKGIAEIITLHGHINVDFADVNTILRDGGVAIMNTGYASGENRVYNAIENALKSPLLKNNDVKGAKKVLFNFYCRQDESSIKVKEIEQINQFMENVGLADQVIWGISFDDNLEEEVKVTLIATGFQTEDIDMKGGTNMENTLHSSLFGRETPSVTADAAGNLKKDVSIDNLFEEHYGNTQSELKKKEEEYQVKKQNIDDENILNEFENTPALARKRNADGPQPYKPRNLRNS